MERGTLYAILKTIQPALATKDLIPVFTCFCFTKDYIVAYDDLVAISHPIIECPIRGAVKGRVLIDWLGSSKARDLKIEFADSVLTLKAGRAKLEVPVLPRKDFLFDLKEAEQGPIATIPLSKRILDGIRLAMLSMGLDPSHPERLGVVLKCENNRVTLYSSNNRSATRVRLKRKMPDISCSLPPRFCTLLYDLAKTDEPVEMILAKEWVEAKFATGTRMFHRSNPPSGIKTFLRYFKAFDTLETMYDIPKGMVSCFDRAMVLIPFSKDPFTNLNIANGRMMMFTDSQSGQARDKVTVEGHPDIEVNCVPELFRKALAHSSQFCVSDQFIAFKGDNFDHMTSVVNGHEAAETKE